MILWQGYSNNRLEKQVARVFDSKWAYGNLSIINMHQKYLPHFKLPPEWCKWT